MWTYEKTPPVKTSQVPSILSETAWLQCEQIPHQCEITFTLVLQSIHPESKYLLSISSTSNLQNYLHYRPWRSTRDVKEATTLKRGSVTALSSAPGKAQYSFYRRLRSSQGQSEHEGMKKHLRFSATQNTTWAVRHLDHLVHSSNISSYTCTLCLPQSEECTWNLWNLVLKF